MIYEMRTYELKPGTVPDFEAGFCAQLPERTKFFPLTALWHTEIGPLNRVIHVWPYESMQHRDEVRAAASAAKAWPPKTGEFLASQESVVLHLAPFSPEPAPCETGGIYEMRVYTYKPGTIPEVLKRFGDSMPQRQKLSPLAAAWYSEFGALNMFIHVWPYKDFSERQRVRAESMKLDQWPPKTREFLVRQDTMILAPAACSPMR